MRIEVPDEVLPADRLGRVHLIGVGGAGLSAIALLLRQQGVDVTGSDAQESASLDSLRAAGVVCHVGHDARHLADRDTVIASTAVPASNPEVVEARRRGLRLWPRSAGLMATMLRDRRIAVSGTHGKTTTTAMLTLALRGAGADPSYAIGAHVAALGGNAGRGSGPDFIVEADESDGAFLHYRPHAAIVTNVDADHLDAWGTSEAYEDAFAQFAATVESFVVCSADDPGCARLLGRMSGPRALTAGFARGADLRGADLRGDDVRIEDGRTRFVATGLGLSRRPVTVGAPGRHYAADALLALAAGIELGHDPAGLIEGLAAYTGAARRMESRGRAAGVRVIDSYAHHPTEIAADLAAGRALAGDGRLVVVFQPHLVSRTRLFGAAMGRELAAADVVVVLDLFHSREAPDPQVTAQLVLDAAGPGAIAGGPTATAAETVAPLVREGDLVLTLGAGDVTTVGPALLRLLGADS